MSPVCRDMARPEVSRITTKQAVNIMFLGNPGTGKTTVARVFAKMLDELDIRKGDFEQTSGQKLVDAATASFNALLKKVTPGVLFIDEVYQLDPKVGGGDGKAITNSLMEATENDRDKLSVIIAGT
jgi:Holliday junction resolvasome RuvABC ATP-dependent DNA helicase subunit